jgi:hypothetical protein
MKNKPTNSIAESIRPEARALWARTTLRVPAEKYYLVSIPTTMLPETVSLLAKEDGRFAVLIVEPDAISLTIEYKTWRTSPLRGRASGKSGPFRVVTFATELDPAVVGYFAPAARRLAEAGISIVPQCAFLKDHLLVRQADLSKATKILEKLIADCKKFQAAVRRDSGTQPPKKAR